MNSVGDADDYVDLDDISSSREAVAYWKGALESEDLAAEDRPACLINLANALADTADAEASLDLAQEAIKYGLLALSHPLLNQASRSTVLHDLSTIYLTLFELEGDQVALHQSVIHIRQALLETPIRGEKRCSRLADLCNILCTSFDAFGHREHIDEAIKSGQEAIETNDVSVDLRAKAFANLAKAYGCRREAYFVQNDSKNAIHFARQAVEMAKNPELKAISRSDLLGLLLNDVERQFSDELVAEALKSGQLAIPDLSSSHKAMCLHNMSYLLRLQYEQSDMFGSIQTLQKAVDYSLEAINIYPGDGPQLAMFEDQLAICLEQAFLGGDHEALSTGIDIARKAIDRAQLVQRINARYKNHLAGLLEHRAQPADLEEAISLSRSVLDTTDATLMDKIDASNTSGMILAHLHDWEGASVAFKRGLDLISKAVKGALNRSDQQYVLSQLGNLSQKATSCTLLAGKSPQEALQTLESGRTMLTRLSILERSGLPIEVENNGSVQHLLPRYRELKASFQRRQTTMSDVGSLDTRGNYSDDAIHRQLQNELDELEAQIKRLAGWEDDTISLSLSSAMVGSDYAIAFNITTISADALIVFNHQVKRLSLPKMIPQDIQNYVNYLLGEDKITSYDLESYRSANKEMLRLLRWLWDVAVCPVLDYLGLRVQNAMKIQLPRICWIAAGPFGLFPIHAAGYHVQGSNDFLMRYACSSYAVSLQSLTWHRGELQKRLQKIETTTIAAAVFTMRTTPNYPSLDVDEEVESVQNAFPSSCIIPCPSVALVEQEARNLVIAHFACHGESDARDPSESRLLFQDSSGNIEGLSVYRLAKIDNSKAWFAFLSACRTADLQSIDHLDENIHIAGGFQIAGFPQVVSTLWLAENDVASRLSGSFYRRLANSLHLSRDTAAYALHEAILSERAKSPQAVLSWTPFVLYGA